MRLVVKVGGEGGGEYDSGDGEKMVVKMMLRLVAKVVVRIVVVKMVVVRLVVVRMVV